jgi:phospholipid/cholesterol/gamma-HCH transport system permease protein
MQLGSLAKQPATIEVVQNSDATVSLNSLNNWTAESITSESHRLGRVISQCHNVEVQWQLSAIADIDSAGMMLFIRFYDQLISQKCSVSLIGATNKFERLNTLCRQHIAPTIVESEKAQLHANRFLLPFESLGKLTAKLVREITLFLSFLGETSLTFVKSLAHPSSIRYAAIIRNIDSAGVQALPIIALTSFLIGIVITYQGAVQLEKFGANIFIVDMIGISITRELAPLITAIVVAGRTGSSYTAQLGVMKITEEIDAMRTMGFDPHHFLVIPRILALMIALPLLVFFADIIGILAGMMISEIHLQLSFSEFIHRLQNVVDVKHVWIGLIKAPFFACLIAVVSCFRGFQVEKNTESIGRYTTISVVNAIFLVIACDALFSVILTELGI